MTRKDYERFAYLLASYKVDSHQPEATPREVADFLTLRMADVLAEDNPRFDRVRFIRAATPIGDPVPGDVEQYPLPSEALFARG